MHELRIRMGRLPILTDSGHVADGEAILSETQQDTGLADTRVANDDELKQVVIACLLGSTLAAFVLCHLNLNILYPLKVETNRLLL